MTMIPDFLAKLFVGRAQLLSWQWIPGSQVIDGQNRPRSPEKPFAAGQDYIVLRLAEMYLKTIRVLWRECYPVVHAFVGYGDVAAPRSVTTVAGPGQLKDLGSPNLDRLIGLSYRLASPIVYDGQAIEILAGLYAVPARDGAKPLFDTLSQLAGAVPYLAQANAVAGILKTGMEGLLGLADTQLTLGIHDTLRPDGEGVARSAKPGFLVAINAPQGKVGAEQLWVKEGRLYEGPNPLAARPFDAHDMMLFELHRGPSRAPTWATLPSLAARARAFDATLRGATDAELKTKINADYRAFEADLRVIDDLTQPDKAAIRALVAQDLKTRAEILSADLIETRSAGGTRRPTTELRSFSARTIEEPPPGTPLASREEGQALL